MRSKYLWLALRRTTHNTAERSANARTRGGNSPRGVVDITKDRRTEDQRRRTSFGFAFVASPFRRRIRTWRGFLLDSVLFAEQ